MLIRISHEILPSNDAEYGDIVVLVENLLATSCLRYGVVSVDGTTTLHTLNTRKFHALIILILNIFIIFADGIRA